VASRPIRKPTPAAIPTDCQGWPDIIFGGGDGCLAAVTQGVFGQSQGFAGAQQAVVDLVAQLVGLIAGQGGGVFEQPLGVGDQSLKVAHQDFLSSLCLDAGHG
jgi:hypothetical protein